MLVFGHSLDLISEILSNLIDSVIEKLCCAHMEFTCTFVCSTYIYMCVYYWLYECYSESLFYLLDEELFKIKKPSFNEVTFRIKKKESLLPAQTEAEESKSKYFF